MWGKKSPQTNVLSNDELKSLKPEQLTDLIKDIYNYKHRIFYYGQNDLKTSFNDIKIDQHEFLVAFTYSYFSLFEIRSERSVLSEYYPPPILVKDIQLLDEVFLI